GPDDVLQHSIASAIHSGHADDVAILIQPPIVVDGLIVVNVVVGLVQAEAEGVHVLLAVNDVLVGVDPVLSLGTHKGLGSLRDLQVVGHVVLVHIALDALLRNGNAVRVGVVGVSVHQEHVALGIGIIS